MASITRPFAVGYVFGIRSCKLFGTSFGETPDPRQPTGGGRLIGQDTGTGQPEKQWLRSMMQQHIVLAVACLRGVINSSRQTDPLRPVYRQTGLSTRCWIQGAEECWLAPRSLA